jgi:hypothetical protein
MSLFEFVTRSVTICHKRVTNSTFKCCRTIHSASHAIEFVTICHKSVTRFCDRFRRRKYMNNKKMCLSLLNSSQCHTYSRKSACARVRGGCDGFLVTDFPARPFRGPRLAWSVPKPWHVGKVLTMNETCACCRYFAPRDFGCVGVCRRNPPLPRPACEGRHDDIDTGVRPLVSCEGGCGQFEPKGECVLA